MVTIPLMIVRFNTANVYIYFNHYLQFYFVFRKCKIILPEYLHYQVLPLHQKILSLLTNCIGSYLLKASLNLKHLSQLCCTSTLGNIASIFSNLDNPFQTFLASDIFRYKPNPALYQKHSFSSTLMVVKKMLIHTYIFSRYKSDYC